MTTINGQLWQRCVECEDLVPAPTRDYTGLCPNCAPAPPEPEPETEPMEITAAEVGEITEVIS